MNEQEFYRRIVEAHERVGTGLLRIAAAMEKANEPLVIAKDREMTTIETASGGPVAIFDSHADHTHTLGTKLRERAERGRKIFTYRCAHEGCTLEMESTI